MRRVAWFCVVVDTENEEVANRWVATVTTALDTFAHQAAEICDGQLTIAEPIEAGQSIPVEGHGV
jgi:hypothetical protein